MWDRFRHVTAPHIRGSMIVVVILQIISALQAFDMIYTLTRGGPGQATVMLNFLTWVNAFERLSIGMAASMAITLVFVIMLLSAVANNFRKNNERWLSRELFKALLFILKQGETPLLAFQRQKK